MEKKKRDRELGKKKREAARKEGRRGENTQRDREKKRKAVCGES